MSKAAKDFNLQKWWLLLPALLVIIYASTLIHYTIDLTAEKRFSLSTSTRKLLQSLDTTINITVFLTGNLPADYKKLNIAASDILDEFRNISNNHVHVQFQKPGEELTDSLRYDLYDSLQSLGVVFEQSEDVSASQEKSTQQLIIPSAIVQYGNAKPQVVDLRSSRKIFKNYNVVDEEPQEDKEATLNSAEALLEYKFANAIQKLTRKYVPTIAYMVGNGEAPPQKVNDLIKTTASAYRFGPFDLKQSYINPDAVDAILIVKPTLPFTDEDKLKLDQYVMHGGKIIWCIDKLFAELDSIMRSQADFLAFDRNLNLDDILFRYGVRINGDLLQDLNCAKIPIVVNHNSDGSPKLQRIPWPYYPFLTSDNNNPISKNIDRVLPVFPSSIDTIKAPGITKTILLSSDTNSRVLSTPAIVSLNSVKDENDLMQFTKSHVPVAVLLQGKFNSLYANRLTQSVQDSVGKALGKPFLPVAEKNTKQIVIADADMVTNAVTQTEGPLPMGELPYENYRFANREFFLNCLDYLVNTNGLFEARNKDFTLRLLDKQKTETNKTMWQLINIVLPVAIVVLFGFIYQWQRKRKYT